MLINSLIEQGKLSQAETEANILIKRMQAEVQTGNEAHWTPATDPRLHLPVTYTMLGMIMLNREDSRAAEKHLLQALSLDSGSHNAQHLLAVAYMGEDRYPEALKAVELAIKLKPQSSASRTLAGVILSKQGYFNQALSRFEEALTMNPNDPIANLEAAMLLATSPTLQKTNGSEALQLAQRALSLSGETARTLDVLAAAYAATGKFDAATQLAQKALNMTSESQPTSSADTLLKSVPQNIRQRLNRYRTAKPWQREN
jgi:tetratricopeptide (TPR) repeat protein